jgi:hypothetical protein
MKETFLQIESYGEQAPMDPDKFQTALLVLLHPICVHPRFVFLVALIRVHSCQFAVALFGFGCGFVRFRFNKNFYVSIV